MIIIIKETEKNMLCYHVGQTEYKGCQCFGDCSCKEEFVSEYYSFYTVVRKNKKTTMHKNIESAIERWNFVNKPHKQ